ncbi:transglycosylase domain-containing protein [Pseudactinotalea sp.]|uniref:transglycosylase domain-containing protein n=1 Tax=Pseudactinotalea sp. TaxID=1926260 RepID=UPI003B3B37BC
MPSERKPTGPARRSVKSAPSSGTGKPSWERTGASSTRRKPASGKNGSTKGPKGKKKFWNFPRRGKGPIRRWLPSWRFMLASVMGVFLLGAGVFFYFYATTDVPEAQDIALAESSTVYFADGETEMGAFAEVNRTIVDPATLPDHVGQAVVASEDRRFYSNSGIDPIGILRALWNNLRGNPTQGGSTLTQQYVERYYTGQTSGYGDKIREVILALKIDREQSKDEILGNYLNTIYFGRGAYGIEAASQAYFDKPASELTVSESALLAGIIPSPSRWDPAVDPQQAEARWERTLGYMVDGGYLTEAERGELVLPETVEGEQSNSLGGTNGYLLDMVRTELLERSDLSEADVYGGGLDIVTTIDADLQALAVAAAEDLPDDAPDNLKVALVSMDPTTGAIVSLYGGPDFVSESRNRVTQDVAQGGSTFKPFTLIAALESGMPLEQRYPSYSPMDIDGYTVRNFDSINRGNIDLVTATENSVNTAYVQMNNEVGPENTVDVATRLGLPEDTAGLEAVPSNVLGSASPHPLDMVTAYSTIASGGERHESFIVAQATNGDGDVLYAGAQPGEQVVDEQVIADATYAMTQVVENGTGRTASEIGRPAAGKTGSSQDYRSAWFVGFVPQLTTAVALYQPGEDGTEEVLTPFGGANPVAGGTWPTTIWTNYMTDAVADLPVVDFPERSAPATPTYQPTAPPTTDEPTTEEPTTEEPTTEEPTTEEPTTEEPTTEEPTTEEPTTDDPTDDPSDDPTSDDPTDDPTSDDPTDAGLGLPIIGDS